MRNQHNIDGTLCYDSIDCGSNRMRVEEVGLNRLDIRLRTANEKVCGDALDPAKIPAYEGKIHGLTLHPKSGAVLRHGRSCTHNGDFFLIHVSFPLAGATIPSLCRDHEISRIH